MSAPSSFFVALGFLFSASIASAAAVSLEGLVSNSPFVLKQTDEAAPAPVTEGAAIEFRGVIATKEGMLFGLYDRTKNLGAWVKQDDKSSDFQVSSYDATNDQVTVNYQGQSVTIPLSSSKIAAAAPSALPVVNAPQANQPNVQAQADNRRRLESVAAEVRRRRALRQSATTSASPRQ
jgi:hypothetical protein